MATSDRTSSASSPAAAARVFVGLGANLGDARATLAAALAAVLELGVPGGVRRASSLWRSAPVDAAGPDFLNQAAELDTALAPAALLDALQAIEARFGRERPFRNAPRTLDLDVLLYDVRGDDGGLCRTDERLQLPHPRAHLRAFVLEPLAELWPRGEIPGQGAVAGLLASVRATGEQRIERVADR